MSLLSLLALFVVSLSAAGTAAQSAPSQTALEIANALQKKYDGIKDFSADFVHQHEGGPVRRKREERGTLLVKKPGKMRWTYKSPDEKIFVSDGTRLYQYYVADNSVIVGEAPGDDQPAVQFLSGRGNLTRDFYVSFAKSSSPDIWTLRLDPKEPQSSYDWLEVSATRDALRLTSLVVGEKTGSRSTFTFTNFKENPGLPDKTFEFTIPKGAEVRNAGPAKR
jgi:outer membrane lipoprotein carrier protein